MNFYINNNPSLIYGEPSPNDIHEIYMNESVRVAGIEELYEYECHDLYVANGLYMILLGSVNEPPSAFYNRHPGLNKWRHYIGPTIINGLVDVSSIAMWTTIDDHLKPRDHLIEYNDPTQLHRR